MLKLSIFMLITSLSFSTYADILVSGGKAYDLKPRELRVCGETGSAERNAAVFAIVDLAGAFIDLQRHADRLFVKP